MNRTFGYGNNCNAYITDRNETIVYATLQSVSYSIHREMAPIYTMPRRSEEIKKKRAIVGTFVIAEILNESPKEFDIVIEATNEEGQQARMKILDIDPFFVDTEEYTESDQIGFVASGIGSWKLKEN
jgi:hypothetical protein